MQEFAFFAIARKSMRHVLFPLYHFTHTRFPIRLDEIKRY